MLEVTTIGNHAGSQALGEVRHGFVDVFLWKLFQDGLQGNYQLISCLMLWLKFMVSFQHGAPDVIIQRVQVWRIWGPLILLSKLKIVRLHPVLCDAQKAEKWGLS